MRKSYIIRRILIFIPTLFAISLIAFIISINAPGDPVEKLFEGNKSERPGALQNENIEKEKTQLRHELGLDLPTFYITLSSLAEPDTFYRIGDKAEREALSRLLNRYGNWNYISDYFSHVKNLIYSAGKGMNSDSTTLARFGEDSLHFYHDQLFQKISSLRLTDDPVEIESKLSTIESECARLNDAGLMRSTQDCLNKFRSVQANATVWKTNVPSLHFYGYNQYHRWLFGDGNMFTGNGARYCKGVIRGDFGISYATKKPVTETISRALPWSVFFTLVSVILAYMISIPIGVKAASKPGSLFDRGTSVVLFMLYSMPTFLMGIVLLVLFANPDMWSIFPANGIEPAKGISPDTGWWEAFTIRLPYYILPIVCYTYSSLAFLSRTTRVSMLEVSSQDFMRTAKAKGLTERDVYYKHGLSNALLPIITVFSNVFPAAIGGSVVLESLFGIPGMGPEIIGAVSAGDFSMIVAVFTLTGFMTLIGYLIADILYSIADPRISFDRK